jgi:hypothetical protein
VKRPFHVYGSNRSVEVSLACYVSNTDQVRLPAAPELIDVTTVTFSSEPTEKKLRQIVLG